MQWDNACRAQPSSIDRMRFPKSGAIGDVIARATPLPAPTPIQETTAPETSAPGGTEVQASDEPAPSPKESGEPLISRDIATGAPELNEVMEEPGEVENEEENFTPDCSAHFDPLADYAQGAERTAHYMI
ncbi:hypothetical protein Q9L58_010059 [Maublancomyces gigas]|uniref:Uncharacterized protein n=1 Tax=Discina gigas TaxID=1032678 RepID=A0ABR3G583_9PEZI